MSSKDAHSLWNELFRDPSAFWDNRHVKTSPKCPDFRHKKTGRPLWIDGWYNPPWVQINLKELNLTSSTASTFLPDRVLLLNTIKSCGKEKNVSMVKSLYADVLTGNLITEDASIATALIKSCVKCGAFYEAQDLLKQLPDKDVVSWTALIHGYVQHGLGHEALNCFRQMQDKGISPNAVTYIVVLKACGLTGALETGQNVDGEVRKQGLLKNNKMVGNMLVDMYAKCGALIKAREVFDELPLQDVVSWTSLISGYTQHGFGDEAIRCFKQMQDEGVSPNSLTYAYALKACGIIGSLEIGEQIDAEVRKKGILQRDIILSTTLIDMYAKCGAFHKGQEIFAQLPVRDVVCWTSLIVGYVQHGLGHEALKCLRQMQDEGVCPDTITYVSILKTCSNGGYLDVGRYIDIEVRKKGLLRRDIMVSNALIDMYAKCGELQEAQETFDQIPMHDVVSWNVLISGYVQHGLGDEALKRFEQMQDGHVCPNTVTYICILKACSIVGSVEVGMGIDVKIRSTGLFQKDVMLGNALVDMYAKCNVLEQAQEVFEELPVRDAVSWTCLITGYCQHGLVDQAFKFFNQMHDKGICPDIATYACILKACNCAGSLQIVEAIVTAMTNQGLLQKDALICNILVEVYVKCGALEKAEKVFEKLAVRDASAWASMISGYAKHGYDNKALNCFRQMQQENISHNVVTYTCILKACSIVGSLEMGEEVCAEIRRKGLLQKDIVLGNALINMYTNCGALEKAQEVFEQLPVRDIVSWSTLIAGYSQTGETHIALELFRKMKTEAIMPNSITFLALLTACSHTGLLKEGEMLFDEMCHVHGFTPSLEHYVCMIDLFGREGHFDKVEDLLCKTSPCDRLPIFLAILGSCLKGMNVFLGRWAFEQSIRLDEKCFVAYILMQNLYAAAGIPAGKDGLMPRE